MTLEERARKCAKALKRLCDEHGADNSWSAREIADQAGFRDLITGRSIRHPAFAEEAEKLGFLITSIERAYGRTLIHTSEIK